MDLLTAHPKRLARNVWPHGEQKEDHMLIRKHGKRVWALLLMLAILPLPSALAAQTARPVTNLFGGTLMEAMEAIQSVAAAGDTLYIRTSGALYTYQPGDAKAIKRLDMPDASRAAELPREVEQDGQPNIRFVLGDGKQLYGIDFMQQTLYTLALEGDKLITASPVKLDLTAFIQGEERFRFVSDPQWAFIWKNTLYMKKQNYEGEAADLYSFSLVDGKAALHQVNNLQSMTPYKDGQFIALQLDRNNMYDPQTGQQKKPEIVLFNPHEDQVTPLGISAPNIENSDGVPAMYYDAAEDSLYLYTDTDLYRYDKDFKQPRLIGHLPMFGGYYIPSIGALLPLADGRLAVAFGHNIFLRQRTEEGLQGITVLTVGSGLDEINLFTRTLMETDDISLRRVQNKAGYLSAEELAAMLLTGKADVDIMPMNAYTYDLDKLIQKGYLADLSESPKMKGYVDKLAPNLMRALQKDGRVYALPVQLMLFPPIAYVKPLQTLGLQPPQTIEELVDLTEKWAAGFGSQHPEYRLFSGESNVKGLLRRLAMESYINSAFGAGQELTFNTPQFRQMMQRIDQLDYGTINEEAEQTGQEGINRTHLIETSMGYEPRFMNEVNNSGDRQHTALVMPLVAGMPAHHQADITLLTVMANSPNKQAAIRFMEHLIDQIDIMDKLALDLSQNQDVSNPDYEKGIAQWKKNLEEAESRYQKVQGAEKNEEQKNLDYMRKEYEQAKESMRYIVTAKSLSNIHDTVSKLYVMTGLMNAQRNALGGDPSLQHQYIEGAITLDEFIKQADDKLRLVRLEYQ